MIFFSILIPAYKSRYLKEAIDSVLQQSYNSFELIIVDDASPENLKCIVDIFDDKRIKYYRNDINIGAINVVDNWNKCLGYANGDYVICMGDDDKLLENCLEEYVKLIHLYPGKKLYHAWTEIIDENSKAFMMQEARPLCESVYSMIWSRWRGRLQYIGDFLYETKTLKEMGGFYKLPLAWGSDDISAFRAAQIGGVVNSQIPLFQYRINRQNISSASNDEIKLSAILQEKAWYDDFLKVEPKTKIDTVFRDMIIRRMTKHFKLKIMSTIVSDLQKESGLKFFSYFLKRKVYGLTCLELAYIFTGYIKNVFIKTKYQ